MSIVPALDDMPSMPRKAGDGSATIKAIRETGDGVLITMTDGRDIKMSPGDSFEITPATRDTQVITLDNPEPRNLRDLHNAGGLPDMIAALMAPRPNVMDPIPPPTPALGAPPPPPPAPPMAPDMGMGGPMPPGGPVPMLPDMAGTPAGGVPPGSGQPTAGSGQQSPLPAAGFPPAGFPSGTPPPLGLGPLGMPPGAPPSPVGPPDRFRMPPLQR